MKLRSKASVLVALCVISAGSLVAWHRRSGNASQFVAPHGNATPEAVACDFVQSYIDQDFELFKSARMASVCETPQDLRRAYDAIMTGAEPLHLNRREDLGPPVRIVDFRPARAFAWTACQQKSMELYQMLNHGGTNWKYVDVVTEDANGNKVEHRVEVMQRGELWRVSPESLQQFQLVMNQAWVGCPEAENVEDFGDAWGNQVLDL